MPTQIPLLSLKCEIFKGGRIDINLPFKSKLLTLDINDCKIALLRGHFDAALFSFLAINNVPSQLSEIAFFSEIFDLI